MPIDGTARLAIIGAGPCGLACARELDRLGHHAWTIYERADGPGGLARSVRDPAGFTWDLGGHVVFSHYGEFDALLAEVMGTDVDHHDRSSYIRSGDRWIPYPFQNHLHHLPPAVRDECLEGLRRAGGGHPDMNFADWMRSVFGDGITRHFMAPYNAKVWATDPAAMASRWIGERVAVVDYAAAAAAVATGTDAADWGPNATFLFPTTGGTGEIFRRMAEPLGERIRYGAEVVAVDPAAGRLTLADGAAVPADAIVSTMPLDLLAGRVIGMPPALAAAAASLVHNSVAMVGVGYATPLSDDRSWMYFPDPAVPFYRVTNFAKYAAAHVPDADTGRYSAYMTETAFAADDTTPRDGLEARVEAGLRQAGVVAGQPPVASLHREEIPYAYPVPTRERDRILAAVQPWLAAHGILSRGRFGTWRYELGNMDHAVKMGIDAARRLVRGEREEAFSGR